MYKVFKIAIDMSLAIIAIAVVTILVPLVVLLFCAGVITIVTLAMPFWAVYALVYNVFKGDM